MATTRFVFRTALGRIKSRLNLSNDVQIHGTRHMSSTIDEKLPTPVDNVELPVAEELAVPQCIPQPVLWGTKMKAIVKETRAPGLTMMDVPKPAIGNLCAMFILARYVFPVFSHYLRVVGPNDVLIKVKKSAICGTDVHIYTWDDWAKVRVMN